MIRFARFAQGDRAIWVNPYLVFAVQEFDGDYGKSVLLLEPAGNGAIVDVSAKQAVQILEDVTR